MGEQAGRLIGAGAGFVIGTGAGFLVDSTGTGSSSLVLGAIGSVAGSYIGGEIGKSNETKKRNLLIKKDEEKQDMII